MKELGSVNFLNIAFAAYNPDLIAVCDPLAFIRLTKPALQPTRIPPGKVNLGIEK
jgi:hypothetical protein